LYSIQESPASVNDRAAQNIDIEACYDDLYGGFAMKQNPGYNNLISIQTIKTILHYPA
jgi:hypothetical protein